jgi:hypothetical protein
LPKFCFAAGNAFDQDVYLSVVGEKKMGGFWRPIDLPHVRHQICLVALSSITPSDCAQGSAEHAICWEIARQKMKELTLHNAILRKFGILDIGSSIGM